MSSHRLTIPVFIHALALAMALCLWAMPAAAYVNLLPEQVKDMVDGQADVTFIDVREPIDFCTQLGGHVPCSLNYPWNSGVLTNNYTDFDSRAPIVVICMTGQRSLKSAQFLESVGFTDVSLMQGGMLDWQWQTETCNEVCPACVSPSCPPLYFAHIDTSAGWTTGLTIVNTGTAQAEGQLKAYDALGSLVDTRQVALAPDGRASFDVAADFADPQDIRYAILESDALGLVGYATFAQPGGSAVSLAAVRHGSTGSLVLPHVPTDGGWWTGLALVNPGSEAVEYIIRFNDGTAVNRILYPGRHEAFTLAQLLGEAPSADMQNAVLEGAGGLVALALYGQTENGALSGLSLNTPRLKEIYLPHVTDDAQWWTGLVACNYGTTDATLNILSYDAAGNQLANSARILAAGRTLVGTAQTLGLPEKHGLVPHPIHRTPGRLRALRQPDHGPARRPARDNLPRHLRLPARGRRPRHHRRGPGQLPGGHGPGRACSPERRRRDHRHHKPGYRALRQGRPDPGRPLSRPGPEHCGFRLLHRRPPAPGLRAARRRRRHRPGGHPVAALARRCLRRAGGVAPCTPRGG